MPSVEPDHFHPLLVGALGITLVSYGSAMLTAPSFAIARSRGLFDAMLRLTGLADRIGADHVFPSVRSGVHAFIERST